jgi:hypothetical protein
MNGVDEQRREGGGGTLNRERSATSVGQQKSLAVDACWTCYR